MSNKDIVAQAQSCTTEKPHYVTGIINWFDNYGAITVEQKKHLIKYILGNRTNG